MLVKKVISGGQTGADLAAGGFAPKGYKVSFPNNKITHFPHLKNYGLIELSSSNYKERTYANIKESDGTVWFGKKTSPGAKCTFQGIEVHKKPLICNPSNVQELLNFLKENNIQTLNVAGNREHTYPGIFFYTYYFLLKTFKP